VKFTGGTGTGATGYAVVSGGVVTGITVTSPGTGYLLGETLTATFFGAAATPATAVTDIPVAANVTTGGMTFQGSGTTSLTGVNTYLGTTTVAGGVLAVTGTSLADSGKLVITSGKVQPTGTEVVDTLFFGAVQQAFGTYGSTASAATFQDDTRFSGTGVISVTTGAGGSAYAAWALTKGLDGTNNGATQDNGDFDGVANVLEFVLGGNPKASDPLILPDPTEDATNFYFTFNRADESEAEVGLTFQYGSDLTGWTDVAVGATTGTSGSGVVVTEDLPSPAVDTVVVTVPKTSAVDAKLFGRLKAVK
jgi:autotransporter-associated beta strand protein